MDWTGLDWTGLVDWTAANSVSLNLHDRHNMQSRVHDRFGMTMYYMYVNCRPASTPAYTYGPSPTIELM